MLICDRPTFQGEVARENVSSIHNKKGNYIVTRVFYPGTVAFCAKLGLEWSSQTLALFNGKPSPPRLFESKFVTRAV